MRNQRFIFGFLGLAIGVASIWAMVQSQQTEKTTGQVQQETYVSKVIIQAPWGAKNLVYDKTRGIWAS
jgi:lipopolysaccharide export system protein LptC